MQEIANLGSDPSIRLGSGHSVLNSISKTSKICLNSLHSKINGIFSFIFIPSEEPTLKSALGKTFIGFIGLYNTDLYNTQNVNRAQEFVSTSVFMIGMQEILNLATKSLYKASPKQKTKKILKKRKIIPIDNKYASQKLMKAFKLTVVSGMSLYCLYNWDILGDTYSIKRYNSLEEMFEKGGFGAFEIHKDLIMILFQTSVCISSLVLNLKELCNFKEDRFLINQPIHEIINAFAVQIFCNQLYLFDSEEKKFVENLVEHQNYNGCDHGKFKSTCKTYNLHSYRLSKEMKYRLDKERNEVGECEKVFNLSQDLLQIIMSLRKSAFSKKDHEYYYIQLCMINCAGMRQLQNSFSLIKDNIISFGLKDPIISEGEIDSLEKQFLAIEDTSQRRNNPYKYSEIQENKNITNTDFDISDNLYLDLPNQPNSEFPITIKIKKKKKGVSGKQKPEYEKKDIKVLNSQKVCYLDLKKDERIRTLKRIKELQVKYPIKKRELKTELDRAATFLGGKITGNKKGMKKLEWKVNNTSFALHYEIPHGKDSADCAGNKRERIINVLNTVYLVGLDEELAHEYINRFNLENLKRFPKLIRYVLLNPQ